MPRCSGLGQGRLQSRHHSGRGAAWSPAARRPRTPIQAVASGIVVQRPPAGTIPDAPGSYQFKDAEGRVIYVGKAEPALSGSATTSRTPAACTPAPRQMVATARPVEWIQVRNEVEALMLEYNLIKQHRPRFNIRLRDDKSYPFLAVTLDEEWPRAMVMRGRKRKGVRYFGPYGHAYAIRETLDLLLRTFPIRTCSPQQVPASTTGSAGRACCSTSRSARAVRGRDRPRRSTTRSCRS